MSIRKIERDGKPQWVVTVDAGRHPDGKRRQIKRTFDKLADAKKVEATLKNSIETNTFIAKNKITVREYLDGWLRGREFGHENTRAGYRSTLKPVYEKFGHMPLQNLTAAALAELKQDMRTTGGRAGRGRSPRTITLTLTVLSKALKDAEKQRLIPFNPASADLVDRPKHTLETKQKLKAWTADQARTFLKHVQGDRYEAAWRLTMLGLRRGEVLGLTWEDIDFDNGVISINKSRTARKGSKDGLDRTVVEAPKTGNGVRDLPMPKPVMDSLKAFKKVQREERLALGRPLQETDFVVADQVAFPISPEWYSQMFKRHVTEAGLPMIRLHDARRTAATLLHTEYKQPIAAAASWLGHDPIVYQRIYVVGEDGHKGIADALGNMQTGTDS